MSTSRPYSTCWKFILAAMLILSLQPRLMVFADAVDANKAAKVAADFAAASGATLGSAPIREDTGAKATQALAKIASDLVRPITNDEGVTVAYVVALEPEGFVIVGADDRIRPVLGYSFVGEFPFDAPTDNALLHLVQWDVSARLSALQAEEPDAVAAAEQSEQEWDSLSAQAWPSFQAAAATQTYGPLLATDWHQSGRYNNRCPYLVPHIPGLRRPVGCVATAMAQVINYWRSPSSVSFDPREWPNGDSYTGNGIRFDADAAAYGFPTFSELNSAMSFLHYNNDDNEVANLCFAAGIKVRMSYGLLGSGAYMSNVGGALRNGFSFGSAASKTKLEGVWTNCRNDVIEKGVTRQARHHKVL